MKWIKTANPKKFRIKDAYADIDSLFWKKGNNDIKPGDIVYIYVGQPYEKIMYETLCVRSNLTSADSEAADGLKYWKDPSAYAVPYECVELKLVRTADSEKLTRKSLVSEEFLSEKERIQGPRKDISNPKLFAYIESVFNEESCRNPQVLVDDCISADMTGEERLSVVKTRVNQSVYRTLLLNRHKKCCFCGLEETRLLYASHIKPWAVSSPLEKIDADNGLLLCSAHDDLFDKGFISFADDGKVLISDKLSAHDMALLGIRKDSAVGLCEGNRKYMKYHRENIFRR